jgi:nitroreductase
VTEPPEPVELYEGLLTTRAMRRFTDEPVTEDQIRACLDAAVQAPSGGNIQPYQFLVVTDPDLRDRIGALYLRAWERYAPAVAQLLPPMDEATARRHERNVEASDELARTLGRVPVLVLVLMPRISMVVTDVEGDMDVGPTYASVYPAVQNLILAARAQGLGTVLTTVWRIHEDELRALCDIPERFEVVALLPLGHPKGRWGVAPRRPAASLTSWDRYGERRTEKAASAGESSGARPDSGRGSPSRPTP